MIPLGLSADDRRAYEDALVSSSGQIRRRTRATIHDQNEQPLTRLRIDNAVLEGEVTVDGNADEEPTHRLRMTLVDPEREIPYDLELDHAVSLKTPIGITSGIYVRALERWVDVPVFYGPVTRYSRSGPEITIDAEGKEHWALEPHRLGRGLSKGTTVRIRDAIRAILATIGEQRFAFDAPGDRLDDPLSLGELSVPWIEAKVLAKELDCQLFYDGAGVLRLRPFPASPAYAFRAGRDGAIASVVSVDTDDSELRNTVRVKWEGGASTITPNPSHSLSPESLHRNGIPRKIYEIVETRKKKKSLAERRGKRILRDHLRIDHKTAFDAVPIPHVEPLDLYTAEHPDLGTVEFRLEQYTLPLAAAAMAVGTKRRIRYPVERFRIRRRRKPRKKKGRRR